MVNVPSEIEQLIAKLTPESRRQRQAALLRPLYKSLIVISLVGLVIMLIKGSNPPGYATIGLSLLLNLLVATLDRLGSTRVAAYFFSIWVNLGIIALATANLLVEHNPTSGVVFLCQLALGVMLAGLLLGARYAFLFTAIHVTALTVIADRYFTTVDSHTGLTIFEDVINLVVPVGSFIILIAIITWLYLRALAQADAHFEVARQQIIQDGLIRRDVAIARDLQLRLYPQPPQINERLLIASRSDAARETSGDFYDFIELGDGLLGIVVADVSGKSIAAALMMALACVTLRSTLAPPKCCAVSTRRSAVTTRPAR